MLAHPVTRQSLACIRCGACLNVCPVYQQIGGHAYGSVYPGPIGAVITPQLMGLEKTQQLPYASSLCGACREVCPVKIDIPRLLLHLRSEITESGSQVKRRASERAAFKLWRLTMTKPWLYKLSARFGRIFQGVLIRNGKIGKVKGIARIATPLTAWTSNRDLRPIERQSFREVWHTSLRKN